MALKSKTVEKVLKKKGFTEDKTGKHKKYVIYIDGKKTKINTHTSHGHKEIDDTILNKMARQMKITRKEFDLFIECTLSEEKYKEMLRAKEELNSN